MAENRTAIIALFITGKPQFEIAKTLGVPKQTVSYTIKRYTELGHEGDRPGRGRKRTARTAGNRKIIKQRIQRNPRVSVRKIARETGISRRTVQRIMKEDLKLKPYKLHKRQLLTDENKKVRLERCRELLRRHANGEFGEILFTDEKLFTVEQCFNSQNDRIWSAKAPGKSAIVARRQNPTSVMVWAGICASGKTPLIFVEQGVKINKESYHRDILEAVVLPWAERHFGNSLWTFQQDSAPAHKARMTQEWCQRNFPNFITSSEWPPYSPDLNPMDYAIWSILEARACAVRHKSLDSLKASLRKAWDEIALEQLRATATNFSKRLQLCIKFKGGHFEN